MDKRISTALIAVRDTVVAITITLPIVVPLAVDMWLRAPEADPDIGRSTQLLDAVGLLLPIFLIASNLGFLIAGWWFRRHRPVAGWDAKYPRRLDWEQSIPIGIAVGTGGLLLSVLLTASTMLAFELEMPADNPLRTLAGSSGLTLVALFVLGTVIAPIGEELFFRGHLFRWSANRCGTTYAYLLSSTIFAVGHVFPVVMPSHFAIAVLYAWSYRRWRTLAVPMVAHATNNAIAIGLAVVGARLAS